MSRIADEIREYVNDKSVSDHYGAWGILRPDQRRKIRELCDTCDMFEKTADEALQKVSEKLLINDVKSNKSDDMSIKQVSEMAKIISNYFDCGDCGSCNFYNCCGEALLAKRLCEAGYRKQEWISVDERLPEENGRYLVCVAIRHLAFEDLTIVVIMGYNKTNGFDVVGGEETVTHWMPLPEAPKKGGE